jgi:hypothetical protein
LSGLLAGEVLFAEVLVTPTGISKGCGYVSLFAFVFVPSDLPIRIVEFASLEDSQRAIRELSEQPLLGRPVFIREVRFNFLLIPYLTSIYSRVHRIGRTSRALVLHPSQEK